MNDTLEFPEIIEPPSAITPAKADLALPDLTKLDLTAVALAQYGDWRKGVAATKSNLSTLVLDLSTPSKIKDARTLRQRLIGEPLATMRKLSAGIKSKMATTSKAIGAELELIEAAYAEADTLILPQIEAREAELEREREAARQIEDARKEKHRTNIEAIRVYVERASAPGMTAERIARGIEQLQAIPTPTKEAWDEFAVPAADAICQTLDKMRALHAAAAEREAEQARQEAQRIENERVAAELAEQKRKLDEQAAELKRQQDEAEAKRLADIEAIRQQNADAEQRERIRAEEAARDEREAAARQRMEAEDRMFGHYQSAKERAGSSRAFEVFQRYVGTDRLIPLDQVDDYIAALNALQPTEYTEARDSQQVLKAEPVTADATDRDAPVTASPRVGAMGACQAADAAAAGDVPLIRGEIGKLSGGIRIVESAPRVIGVDLAVGPDTHVEAVIDTRPPINVGEINRRLPVGLTMTRAGIEGLGITPASIERGIAHWHESAWPSICEAIRDAMDERIEQARAAS